jgi:hypothetical protein
LNKTVLSHSLKPCLNPGWISKKLIAWHWAHPNLRENAISWAQGPNAWCQITVNLYKKGGRRA